MFTKSLWNLNQFICQISHRPTPLLTRSLVLKPIKWQDLLEEGKNDEKKYFEIRGVVLEVVMSLLIVMSCYHVTPI